MPLRHCVDPRHCLFCLLDFLYLHARLVAQHTHPHLLLPVKRKHLFAVRRAGVAEQVPAGAAVVPPPVPFEIALAVHAVAHEVVRNPRYRHLLRNVLLGLALVRPFRLQRSQPQAKVTRRRPAARQFYHGRGELALVVFVYFRAAG